MLSCAGADEASRATYPTTVRRLCEVCGQGRVEVGLEHRHKGVGITHSGVLATTLDFSFITHQIKKISRTCLDDIINRNIGCLGF